VQTHSNVRTDIMLLDTCRNS